MSVLYDVEWRLASTDVVIGSVSGLTTVDYYYLSGLSSCTSYEWRIRADDFGTKSDWSDWTAFQTALVTTAVNVVVVAHPPCVNGVWRTADETSGTADETSLKADKTCSPFANVGLLPVNVVVGTSVPSIATGVAVSISSVNVNVDLSVPSIHTGASVSTSSVDILIETFVPSIATGVNVEVPVQDIGISAIVPSIATGASVEVPVQDILIETSVPSIATGASVEVPVQDVEISAIVPLIATGVNIFATEVIVDVVSVVPMIQTGSNVIVPFSEIIINVPDVTFVGMMPDGVDRPRVVSSTRRLRVSRAI